MKVLIIYHDGATHNGREIFKALAKCDGLSLAVIVPTERKVEKVYEPSGWLCVEREEENDGYRMIPVPLRNPDRAVVASRICAGAAAARFPALFLHRAFDLGAAHHGANSAGT